ncbi:contact-dependent growth inhibition system immunity protein [Nocardioides sp. URHA0020]|uniref:contact-dependent growth inhibition system immunity protein n=1 Tax=Nocardioides sp. URHA0020 TaxID=1380392 RepID=UPI000AAEFCD8|nr:contact-dependent growth inhibition system immunity protein [Nocardioides sp. URHA0020]
MNDVPALDQLMGAYFHQDWDVDGDEWDVLDLFRKDEPGLAAALPDEIERTLADHPDEAGLRSLIVDELGGSYAADGDGGTYREWLTQIADRIRTTPA